MLNRSGADRVLERLERLYRIGGGEGANRPGYSPEEQEGCDLVASWMEEAGLEVEWDPFGNLVGRLHGTRPELPEVWTGSHLDSVPSGGKFDGSLGVVAGLEAVERTGRKGRTIATAVFRAEEGVRFGGCLGSRALCGRLGDEELDTLGVGGVSARDAVTRLALPRGVPQLLPGTFVELHVEQGPRLDALGAPLGVVTAIAGQLRTKVVFQGVAGHAGTTPMAARDDALVSAAEFILRARAAALSEDAVATVGEVEVEPGAVNVIPGRVTLSLDARAGDAETLARLAAELGADASGRNDPVPMSGDVRTVLKDALERRGASSVELPSWAGHDAGVLAAAGVPSGMLFVRSLAGGASHSPAEESSPDDVALAVEVLADALGRLATA
ncbi:MAG: Zn-dependent hydrolase [Gaiellaceae bacterium]